MRKAGAVGHAKAEHFVARITRRLGQLHRDPGIHGEHPAQRDCARHRPEGLPQTSLMDSPLEEAGSNYRSHRLGLIFRDGLATRPTNRLASLKRILTNDKGGITVRRARLAPAMISTPGHRASRRRQRGALPAWSYSVPGRPALASCGTPNCRI